MLFHSSLTRQGSCSSSVSTSGTSRGSGRVLCLLNHPQSGGAIFASEKLVALAFEAMVVDEEVLELAEELLWQILWAMDIGVEMVFFGDGKQTVIADLFLAVELFSLDDSDESGANGNTRVCRLVHQQEHVNGITVGGKRSRQKAEVVGEGHPGRENFVEREDALVGIEGELVAARFGRFDNDLEAAVMFVNWLQVCRVSEAI
jgi:hypothetical protein